MSYYQGEKTMTRVQFDILEMMVSKECKLSVEELCNSLKHDRDVIKRAYDSLESSGNIIDGCITDLGKKALEPYACKRAVFLAAGFGSRMIPITINTPKPLVRVHGVRIIDRLIDSCLKAGINEIIIIRGYLAELFDQLKNKYPNIRFIDNPTYDEANNIGSTFLARHLLSNTYVIESDLLVSNSQIIKKYHYSSDFLAIKKQYTDDWCFKVEDGLIQEEMNGGKGDDIWQMVGISYWNESDGKRLSQDIETVYATSEGKNYYWEQVPLVYCKDHYRVEVLPCRQEDVVEIDTFEELKEIDNTYAV